MAKCKRNRNRTKRSFTVKEPKANRNYKDTVFRMLFSDRKNLLSLYNAVNQTDYKNPEELEIVTLENAIYMGMKNDLAFEITVLFHLTENSCPPILLNFIMVRRELLIAQNFGFPRHLSICQASQNLNWLLRFSMSMKDTMQS